MRRLADRLTFANVVSLVALFIALGGGAYAAVKVKQNSVGTRQVKDNSLTGDDISEQALGSVPSATDADRLDGLHASELARRGLHWQVVYAANQASSPPGHFRCFGSDGVECDVYFSNFDGPGGLAGVFYARDSFGIVHLQGSIRFNSSLPTPVNLGGFLQLPPGYAPPDRRVFGVLKNGTEAARLDIADDGYLSLGQDYEPGDWFSLDGIDFPCGPTGADGCPGP